MVELQCSFQFSGANYKFDFNFFTETQFITNARDHRKYN
jgi:hypothetical protein